MDLAYLSHETAIAAAFTGALSRTASKCEGIHSIQAAKPPTLDGRRGLAW